MSNNRVAPANQLLFIAASLGATVCATIRLTEGFHEAVSPWLENSYNAFSASMLTMSGNNLLNRRLSCPDDDKDKSIWAAAIVSALYNGVALKAAAYGQSTDINNLIICNLAALGTAGICTINARRNMRHWKLARTESCLQLTRKTKPQRLY